jgi:hypothetical protein
VSTVAAPELVGRTGVVTIAVRGGAKPGEVRVVVEGIPHHYIAYCIRAMHVGAQVLVINSRGQRQVDVEPWGSSAAMITDSPSSREAF